VRRKKPTASAAIVTGIGVIAFALFYHFMGIYPSRTRWSPGRVVVQSEEPAKFRGLVLFTVALGAGILAWGIARSRKG
jgi:hypothetical protein